MLRKSVMKTQSKNINFFFNKINENNKSLLEKNDRNLLSLTPLCDYIKILEQKFENKMNFDGCSKGNPGLAGAGAVIYTNSEEVWSGSTFIGTNSTNNEAEYAGLILGLEKALDMNIKTLFVNGDSQLVINQMTGKYTCNSPNLIPLFQNAKDLEKCFEKIEYQHLLRNFNHRADELANIAITDYCVKKLVYK
jgi:ribonuclease HI